MLTDIEFQRVLDECRSRRGALTVLRLAAEMLPAPAREFAELEKLLQDGSKPKAIQAAVQAAIQAIEARSESAPTSTNELLRALLLATEERIAKSDKRPRLGQ